MQEMKIDRDSFRKLIDTLVEQGDVRVDPLDQTTKKGIKYVLFE
jgi:hypothetical protein